MIDNSKNLDDARIETRLIRQQAQRSTHQEHSVPIFLSASYVFADAEEGRALFAGEQEGNIYSRYSNPNTSELEEKVAIMEGCESAVACASGMAAVFASLASFLNAGDHVVASRALFGSSIQIFDNILSRWNISCTYVDLADQDQWRQAIEPNTTMLFAETPSNPALQLGDLEFLGALAAEKGLLLNVDNCFATPLIQQPARWGAHIITHSATKFMDGQGRVLGGLVVGSDQLMDKVRSFTRHSGPAMSPFNAWTLSKSLETIPVRMEKHCSNALALAQWLEDHPRVREVRYPFLPSHSQYELATKQMSMGGGVLSFAIDGDIQDSARFLSAIQTISLSSNLGDTRTIATHPATMTHSKLSKDARLAAGIPDSLIRLSVGLEHVDDLKKDLDRALHF